jgi:hypothetical protein
VTAHASRQPRDGQQRDEQLGGSERQLGRGVPARAARQAAKRDREQQQREDHQRLDQRGDPGRRRRDTQSRVLELFGQRDGDAERDDSRRPEPDFEWAGRV